MAVLAGESVTQMDEIEALLTLNAAPGVKVSAGPILPFLSGAFPCEIESVRRAVPSRRIEFHNGRWRARQALAKLGLCPTPLPVLEDRTPLWPPGYVGSISHSRSHVAAAVARLFDIVSIGVDIEPLSTDLRAARDCILTDSEQGNVADSDLVLIFSAKECFKKLYFSAFRAPIEFRAVSVKIDEVRQSFFVEATRNGFAQPWRTVEFSGRFAIAAEHVVTMAVVARADALR